MIYLSIDKSIFRNIDNGKLHILLQYEVPKYSNYKFDNIEFVYNIAFCSLPIIWAGLTYNILFFPKK